jgi:putative NIF3 family GTP cyclohydrolase 1 type 2
VKVLIDEQLPHSLRNGVARHEVVTAAYAGFRGLKNGKLLDAAESAGFDVLITGDTTLHLEQNLSQHRIALVVLSAVEWPMLEQNIAKIQAAVDAALPGSFTRVDCGVFTRKRPGAPGPMAR